MSTPPKIDETDRKILRALRADGRLTNLKLAEQVGLFAGTASGRWKRRA